MKQDVFKVVKMEGEKRVSAVESGDCKLEYLPNTVTKPKRGKIFAFSTLEFAIQFIDQEVTNSYSSSTFQIWKAAGKNPKAIKKICLCPTDDGNFWKNLLVKDMHLGSAPEGTLIVDEIELLERAN